MARQDGENGVRDNGKNDVCKGRENGKEDDDWVFDVDSDNKGNREEIKATYASAQIGITVAMARSLVAVARRAIDSRMARTAIMGFATMARMMFATMARMTFARIGRMERRMMIGYLTLIAIAIVKAIVAVMTVPRSTATQIPSGAATGYAIALHGGVS